MMTVMSSHGIVNVALGLESWECVHMQRQLFGIWHMPGIQTNHFVVKDWTEYLKDAKNMPEPEPVDGNGDDEHECIEEQTIFTSHLFSYLPKIMSAFAACCSYIMTRTS